MPNIRAAGFSRRLCQLPDFFYLIFLSMIMLCALNQLIKYHGDCAQYNNGSNHHVELEETESVGERDRHACEYVAFQGLTDFRERFGVIVFCGRILYNIF